MKDNQDNKQCFGYFFIDNIFPNNILLHKNQSGGGICNKADII